MHLLYFNSKAELVSDKYIDSDNGAAYTFVEMGPVGLDRDQEADDSNQPALDVAVMLAYNKGVGKSKDLHPATEYKYIRASAQGDIKETIRVDSPVGAWLVGGFVPMTDGSVLLYGPANDDTKKYLNDAVPPANTQQGMSREEAFKAKNFVLAKIKGGAVAWITKPTSRSLRASKKCPPARNAPPTTPASASPSTWPAKRPTATSSWAARTS